MFVYKRPKQLNLSKKKESKRAENSQKSEQHELSVENSQAKFRSDCHFLSLFSFLQQKNQMKCLDQ